MPVAVSLGHIRVMPPVAFDFASDPLKDSPSGNGQPFREHRCLLPDERSRRVRGGVRPIPPETP